MMTGFHPAALSAQSGLEAVARQARDGWLRHDADGLVRGSDAVRLELPGVGKAGSLSAGQAARILARYLAPSKELSFELRGIQPAGEGRGYVEALRRYVVRETSDVHEETVFLGFQQAGGRWRLSEVRVVP